MLTSDGKFKLEDESKYSSKIKRSSDAEWEKIIGEVEIDVDFEAVHIELKFGIFDTQFKISGSVMKICNPLNLFVSTNFVFDSWSYLLAKCVPNVYTSVKQPGIHNCFQE